MLFRMRCLGLLCVVALLAPMRAGAGDGVLEINQACVAAGCFAGDAPEFPVEITPQAPAGSFRLTSDLVVTNENTTAIAVTRSGTSIDLAGFGLHGPTVCTGSPICTPNTGSGVGINAPVQGIGRISVRDGEVTGFGFHGVFLLHGEVRNVRSSSNRGVGMYVGTGRVEDCLVSSNGSHGVAGSTVVVTGTTAHANGASGISTGAGVVTENNSRQNGNYGVLAGGQSLVARNVTNDNISGGIRALGVALILDNTSISNGTAVPGDGVDCQFTGCAVRGNLVSENTAFGLRLSAQATYRENTITSNGAGTVSGGVNEGDNHCYQGMVASNCP